MSYATMDHAEWVEANMLASRRFAKKPKRDAVTGEIRGPHGAPEKLNAFQARFFDILGMVGGGIYNCPIGWDGVYWTYGAGGIAVPWRHGSFATTDYDRLTRLVFLALEARIRIELRVHGRGWLICAWPRSHDGDGSQRHPSLDEAVAQFRSYLPEGHRVTYQPERDDPLPAWDLRSLRYVAETGMARSADKVIAADPASAKWRVDFLRSSLTSARKTAARIASHPDVPALLATIEAEAERAEAHLRSLAPPAPAVVALDLPQVVAS